MSEFLFLDKELKPDIDSLSEALGKSFAFWQDIKNYINETYGETVEDWKFYSKKSGWTLKTLLKKRNLFFFKPYKNYFSITFVFGDKAVSEIEKSAVAEEFKETLKAAHKYAEGRGLNIEVKSKKYVNDIKKLVEIKLKN